MPDIGPIMMYRFDKLTFVTIFALFLLATGVNILKPVQIDDTAYIKIADAILRDPFHPLSQTLNWGDTAEPIFNINQPPLLSYAMAAVMLVFGRSVVALHVLWCVFSLGSILAFYALARSQVSRPLLLTCLFAAGPAFLPSQNLMFDVPLVGLWCLFFFGITIRGRTGYWLSAATLSLALLVKYTSLVLFPIFVLVIALRKQWNALWFVLVPICVVLLWSSFNLYDYGAIHIGSRPSAIRETVISHHLVFRSIDWVAGVGLACVFVVLLSQLIHNVRLWVTTLALTLALMCVSLMWVSLWVALTWALFFGAGLMVLAAVARAVYSSLFESTARRETGVWLALWLGVTSLFIIVLAPFVAIRHILLIVPAVLLAMGLELDRSAVGRFRVGAVFVVTTLTGIFLSVSDFAAANVYRIAARELSTSLASGRRIWSIGHWGWQYYAEAVGMLEYDARTTCVALGDYVVVPMNIHVQRLNASDTSRLVLTDVYSISAPPATYLRTVFSDQGGGYYYYVYPWILPVKWSRAPFEFRVFQVGRRDESGTPVRAFEGCRD